MRERKPTNSQPLRPFLPRVENGDDLEAVASQPVGDDVRCSGDHHFLEALDSRDVRVVQRGQDLRFAFEAGQPIGVGGEEPG
jgi:hypothetical protein